MRIVLPIYKYTVQLNDPCAFPLGALYIVSVLKANGHDVRVLNYNLMEYDFAAEAEWADVVLFTGFEAFASSIERDSVIAHSMGRRTIVGGALATFCPDVLRGAFDAVVVGEGESGVLAALYKNGVISDGSVDDIDSVPYPDLDAFGIREYHRRCGYRWVPILTSRGCPYSCVFCAHTCRFRVRAMERVEAELDHLVAKYDPQMIVVNDNTLNASKRRFMEFCGMVRKYGVPWSAAVRPDLLDEESVLLAKECGAHHFVVGVESMSQSRLDMMNKRMRVERLRGGLDLLHKHGVSYHGNLLFGFSGDTESVVKDEIVSGEGYNLFPVVVQPFVGTRADVDPSFNRYIGLFRGMAEAKGFKYADA